MIKLNISQFVYYVFYANNDAAFLITQVNSLPKGYRRRAHLKALISKFWAK